MPSPAPYETSPLPNHPSNLQERLRWLRKQRGLTQVELAEALGCDQAMISSWELGRTRPTAVTLAALARFHGLDLADLETGEAFLELANRAVAAARDAGRACTPRPEAVALQLEPVPPGKVNLVDLATETTTSSDPTDVMSEFLRAVKKGREVWVVLR